MPERDAVREALVRVLMAADSGNEVTVYDLCVALGIPKISIYTEIADALLSRAQPEGERPCTNPHNDTSDPNRHCWHTRETCCHCETSRDATRPAPVVTEAMAIAAMREFSAQKGESHDALWSALDDKTRAELVSEWQHIVDCALAAARGEA